MRVIDFPRYIDTDLTDSAGVDLHGRGREHDTVTARTNKPSRPSIPAPDVTGFLKPLMASLEHAGCRQHRAKIASRGTLHLTPGSPAPTTFASPCAVSEKIDQHNEAEPMCPAQAPVLGMTFSGFLQRLPAMWCKRPLLGAYDPGFAVHLQDGHGSFWTGHDSFAYCSGKDTLSKKVQRALYIASIALPRNAVAVALSARVVRFITPENRPGPVASVIDALNRSSPSITFLFKETPDGKGWQTNDVTIRQVMMISTVTQSEIKERLRTLATIIQQTEAFLVSLSRVDLRRSNPSDADARDSEHATLPLFVPPLFSVTLPIATDAMIHTREYAFASLVQAIALQNLPQTDTAFIAFATSLSQVIHQQRTSGWSLFSATPTLDLSRMHAENTISFWTSDQTEVRATRMPEENETVVFYACAYNVTVAGIGPQDEPAFWAGITKIAAPFECLADPFGNIALLHRVRLADADAKTLAHQTTDFWQRMLKVRQAFLSFETGARTSGIVTHPVYDPVNTKRPIPLQLIHSIHAENARRLTLSAEAFCASRGIRCADQ